MILMWRRQCFFFIVALFLFEGSTYADKRENRYRTKDKVEPSLLHPDVLPQKAGKSKTHISSSEVYGLDLWTNYGKEGLDVSHYQGRIDWETVRNTEKYISYVYVKATEGELLVDDTYRQNLEGAKNVGFKVGSYHFYRPNVSVDKQFQNMKSNVKKEEQDLIPLIDIETKGNVSSEKFVSDLKTFLEQVTLYYGKKPVLYSFYNFYSRYLRNLFPDYKLMIARYHTDVPVLEDGQEYIIWQYTARGRVLGIKSNVDRSKIMPGFSLGDLIY